MAWNKPNDHESELDPWGKKKSNNKYDNINKIDKNQSIKKNNTVDDKTFLFKIRRSIINTKNFYNILKKMDNPFFIAFLMSCFIWCSYGFYIIKENEKGVITTFGKFNKLAEPGLNWRPIFINNISIINVSRIYESNVSTMTLTLDENIVRIVMNVEYKIIKPVDYLFSVSDPENSLRQAIDSVIRSIIRNTNINNIVNTEQNSFINKIEKKIEEIIKPYKMGIKILDINIQAINMPKEVESDFKNVIQDRANRDQYIRDTKIYLKDIEYDARRHAEHIFELSILNASNIISEAEEKIVYFSHILSEYRLDKKIILKHLYLTSMDRIIRSTKKILIDQKDIPLLFLSFGEDLKNNKLMEKLIKNNKNSHIVNVNFVKNNKKNFYFSQFFPDNTLTYRRINTIRSDIENLEK